MQLIQQLIFLIPILLISLSFHEFLHGYASYKLGDPTPKINGRLTLNPLAHLDPIGSLVLLITRRFGWAKPVPINPNYYKNPRKGMMIVGIAGPGANFMLALLFSATIKLILNFSQYSLRGFGGNFVNLLLQFLVMAIMINLSLAFFNLIPIPPLDGSKILRGFLPAKFDQYFNKLEGPAGMVVLIILLYTGIIWNIIGPIINFLLQILVY
ncbi:MAG TPA: site-2 protease family protein [Halanaerobiales bacterium]|nr:site-2 protease family protein [Halanaerobiales bacterium]